MLTYEPKAGESIEAACRRLVDLTLLGGEAAMTFNGREIKATADSARTAGDMYALDLVQAYRAACEAAHAAYMESEEGKAAATRRSELDAVIATEVAKGPEKFDIVDVPGWAAALAANQDGYGAAGMRYCARWASTMDAMLAKGEGPLEAIAEYTSHKADIEGITGFMYGMAVGILAKVWRHGEALRRWHNSKTALRASEARRANDDGQGVINPAVFVVYAGRR